MSIKRPVCQVQSTGQLALLDTASCLPASESEESTDSESVVRFHDPDPEQIWYGDRTLRSFLTSIGLEFAFVLRELFRELDWSDFESEYRPGGRPPYAPVMMASLIVYGITRGVSSLRGLEELAKRDLVCHWLSGGCCPDHATFGRFIAKHQDQLSGPLFERVTKAVLARLPDVDTHLSGDGTRLESAASRLHTLNKEAIDEWVERTDDDQGDDGPTGEAKQARKCQQEARKRIEGRKHNRVKNPEQVKISPSDPEAVFHRLKQKRGWGFGYVPSLMTNQQRLIVAQTVHTTSEVAVVADQLEQAERLIGPASRLCLDSNYFTYDIIGLCVRKGLDILCPPLEKKEPKKFPKHQFRWESQAGHYVCPAGEALTARGSVCWSSRRQKNYQNYATDACNQGCQLREGCTSSRRGRRIKRWEDDPYFEGMRQVMTQPRAQQAYARRRGSIEPVFGELRDIQGLTRAKRRGLASVAAEFSLHAMAHNLRRLKILLNRAAEEGTHILLAIFTAIRSLKTSYRCYKRHDLTTWTSNLLHQPADTVRHALSIRYKSGQSRGF